MDRPSSSSGAFVAKMVGTLVRYAVTFEVYAGRADAGGYHGSGRRLAEAFWDGTWDQVYATEVPELVGTEFMRLATGIVYIVTGPTKLGGFLVFSWLGFWGLYWFYRAFRDRVPRGRPPAVRGPAVLPAVAARTGRRASARKPGCCSRSGWRPTAWPCCCATAGRGYVLLCAGLAGTAMVRPHVTLLVFVALFIAYLMRRRSWAESEIRAARADRRHRALMVLVGGIVLAQAASFFNLADVDREGVEQVLDRTEDQSCKGGLAVRRGPAQVAGGVPGGRAHRAVPAVPMGGGQRPGAGGRGRRARCCCSCS